MYSEITSQLNNEFIVGTHFPPTPYPLIKVGGRTFQKLSFQNLSHLMGGWGGDEGGSKFFTRKGNKPEKGGLV